jgi:hypothetical protein
VSVSAQRRKIATKRRAMGMATEWTSSDKRKRRLIRTPMAKMLLLLLWCVGLQWHVSHALVQQVQVVARCLEWRNGSCDFTKLEPITFATLNLTEQTLCRVRLCMWLLLCA